jgi:hypothetical protein
MMQAKTQLRTTLGVGLVSVVMFGLLASPAGAQTAGDQGRGSVASGTCSPATGLVPLLNNLLGSVPLVGPIVGSLLPAPRCPGSDGATGASSSPGGAAGAGRSGGAVAANAAPISGPRSSTPSTRPPAATPRRSLAVTGAGNAELAAAALVLMALGGALVVVADRQDGRPRAEEVAG